MAESKSPKDSHGAEDENKRKFREALDRKLAKSSDGSDHKESGGKQSRAHGHGPAESRREFRRKSG
jgi:Family of unknown function (DUF5302)